MLLKVYCVSLSAVGGCAYDWQRKQYLTKTNMNLLLNSTSFQLWSIKKRGKHGKYRTAENTGVKHSAWYMKTVVLKKISV